jgi:hypothetical protein
LCKYDRCLHQLTVTYVFISSMTHYRKKDNFQRYISQCRWKNGVFCWHWVIFHRLIVDESELISVGQEVPTEISSKPLNFHRPTEVTDFCFFLKKPKNDNASDANLKHSHINIFTTQSHNTVISTKFKTQQSITIPEAIFLNISSNVVIVWVVGVAATTSQHVVDHI